MAEFKPTHYRTLVGCCLFIHIFTAMTKLLGKAKFDKLLGNLVEKPKGKPALVPASDRRPAMNNAANAADDFKEEN